jgi:uncharacterized membrane protein
LSPDSRGRSLAKTAVYRTVSIALLAAITYYYTGNAGEATTITILFNGGGALAYYGLERLWESIDWGRRKSIAIPQSNDPSAPISLSLGAQRSEPPASRRNDVKDQA